MRLALIGGGRWARVHATVLHEILGVGDEIFWASEHNLPAIEAEIARHGGLGPKLHAVAGRDEALGKGVGAVIVASAPYRHFEDAAAALERGASVLVEKPLTLDPGDASRLVDMATRAGKALGIGLTFSHLPILGQVARWLAGKAVRGVELCWIDPPVDFRHGEKKVSDLTVHKAHDLYPHLWSILDALLPGGGEATVFDVRSGPLGNVQADFVWAGVPARLTFGRRGERRQRRINLELDEGTAIVEFSIEPGTFTVDGVEIALPRERAVAGPLATELTSFLRMASDPAGDPNWRLDARRCIGTVTGACALHDRVAETEAAKMAVLVGQDLARNEAELAALLVDNLAPALAGQARLTFADDDGLRALVRDGLAALRGVGTPNRFSDLPWIAAVRSRRDR